MAVLPSSPTGRDDTTRSSRPVASAPEVPRRADGVVLIGELVGSGYREPPSLARRGDGQTIQLTGLLHLVLESVDGVRDHAEIASRVSARFGRTVTADNVRTLVDQQLRPMGLLTRPDGTQPVVKKSNPLLALRFKVAVSDPQRTRRLTGPFARLFHPVVVVAVLAAFLAVCWWVFWQKGLASATYQAFDNPGLLLLVVAVTVLSAGFHEFGHAAAARRGGATPGVMGAGLYLVWPAFYTDVTDSYRLGRGGRVRTDLGGLYFNAIVAVLIAGAWWATGWDALLLVVATQILQMVHQLTPLVRFDGYHVLADVTGVPDLFHRIRPTLLGLLPWRWHHPESTVLKPWARTVVTVWVLAVVPLLAFSLFAMVESLPRLLGTAWVSMLKQAALLGRAWGETDLLEVAARAISVVAVVFPVLAIGLILFRLVRSTVRKVWHATRGRPVHRGAAALVSAALVAGLAWAWWPHPGSYRPVQPYEGGTLRQAVGAITVNRAAPTGLRAGQYGRLVTAWGTGDARPTADHPQLALVLVPHGSTISSRRLVDTSHASGGAKSSPWVFPFDKPLAPGKGDNQALAVSTRDDTIDYDVAFALVWVTDDSPALNRNEAYAFSSCEHCAAVSVAFQVVLVTGDNHVAAPQNISAAVNYDCVNCLSYALATQLFVTLDGPLSARGQQQITDLWAEIAQFGSHIADVPLSQVRARLSAYEQQILSIIEKEQGPLTDQAAATPTGTATGTSTATATATATGTPTDAGSADAGPTEASTQAGAAPSVDASSSAPDGSSSPAAGATGSATPSAGAATATPTGDGAVADATP